MSTAITAISLDINTVLLATIGIITVIVNGPVAWILRNVVKEQKRLEVQHIELGKEYGRFKEKVHDEFVKQKDLYPRLGRMEHTLDNIFNKLDGKADK